MCSTLTFSRSLQIASGTPVLSYKYVQDMVVKNYSVLLHTNPEYNPTHSDVIPLFVVYYPEAYVFFLFMD